MLPHYDDTEQLVPPRVWLLGTLPEGMPPRCKRSSRCGSDGDPGDGTAASSFNQSQRALRPRCGLVFANGSRCSRWPQGRACVDVLRYCRRHAMTLASQQPKKPSGKSMPKALARARCRVKTPLGSSWGNSKGLGGFLPNHFTLSLFRTVCFLSHGECSKSVQGALGTPRERSGALQNNPKNVPGALGIPAKVLPQASRQLQGLRWLHLERLCCLEQTSSSSTQNTGQNAIHRKQFESTHLESTSFGPTNSH